MAKPHPRRASRPSSPAIGLLVLAPLPLLAGCRSTEGWAADADRDVYEIIRARRAELEVTGGFSVEPPEDTLRSRILAGQVTEIPALTLVDALEIAAEGNRTFQSEREALYLEALDLTLERWDFSVKETGTIGAAVFGTGEVRADGAVGGGLGLTKLFASGLRVISDIGFGLARDLTSGSGWDLVTNLSLNVTQPILRGYGRSIVLEPLTQAERDVLYQARRYESFRRDLAVDVANRFFRILSQYDRLSNEEANYARRQALRLRNEAFAEAGKLTDIDVDQARQDELAARDRLVEARRSLEASLDDFKFFLGLPIETLLSLDRGSRSEIEKWKDRGSDVGEAQGVRLALDRRFDFQTTLDRVVDAERRVRVAADALRAGLDVELDGRASSQTNKPLGYAGGEFDWTLRIDFDAALDRLPERNAYRATLLSLQAARRSAEQEADGLRADVRAALRNLEAARETYEIQSNAVVLAERRVESSQLSLDAGRAETRDVLESQNALVAAQNDASLAFTDFILAIIELHRTMECLTVTEDGIQLEAVPIDPDGGTTAEEEQP